MPHVRRPKREHSDRASCWSTKKIASCQVESEEADAESFCILRQSSFCAWLALEVSNESNRRQGCPLCHSPPCPESRGSAARPQAACGYRFRIERLSRAGERAAYEKGCRGCARGRHTDRSRRVPGAARAPRGCA